jgi:hypothetical protein
MRLPDGALCVLPKTFPEIAFEKPQLARSPMQMLAGAVGESIIFRAAASASISHHRYFSSSRRRQE